MDKMISKQQLKNYLVHLPKSVFWNLVNNFPSKKLKIIGVTGTDGKTTTANMIYHILEKSGCKVGMVSTIGAKYNGKEMETGFHVTSPDPKSIQSFLKQMVKDGIEIVVLETTSHALDQFRYFGIKFDIAVFTNITHEHLDYHQTYEKYVEAKLSMIDNLKPNGVVVANVDDKSIEFVKRKSLKKWGTKISDHLKIYGQYDKVRKYTFDMLGIENVKSSKTGISFFSKEILSSLSDKQSKSKALPVELNILGDYNAYNSSAAMLACLSFDKTKFALQSSINALKSFTTLKGRMEIMSQGNDKPTIIVDFAHTPNALSKALSTLKNMQHKKIITVFGCAGLRDVSKRPMMGEIAAKFSDIIILVPEDPRTVSQTEINDQIEVGIKKVKNPVEVFRFEENSVQARKDGIKKAIQLASAGDIVIICGKGHENSLCFGTTEYDYSDQESVRELLGK